LHDLDVGTLAQHANALLVRLDNNDVLALGRETIGEDRADVPATHDQDAHGAGV
jgi:hypothetical protein